MPDVASNRPVSTGRADCDSDHALGASGRRVTPFLEQELLRGYKCSLRHPRRPTTVTSVFLDSMATGFGDGRPALKWEAGGFKAAIGAYHGLIRHFEY